MSQRLPTIEAAEIDVATHYRHSSLRERIIEHIFVGDALRPRRPRPRRHGRLYPFRHRLGEMPYALRARNELQNLFSADSSAFIRKMLQRAHVRYLFTSGAQFKEESFNAERVRLGDRRPSRPKWMN